jgi:predicted alpha/beta hydrolase
MQPQTATPTPPPPPPPPPTQAQALTITTDDGFTLSGQLYGNPAEAHAALLIAPAMGVAQSYYAPFARWLVSQGFVVLSFDYRGMGQSRPAEHRHSLRGFDADIHTWGQRDAAAALATLDGLLPATQASPTPIHWLGHSLGGQIFGLVPNRDRVARMVTIGTGSGYWLENAAQLKRMVWWLWFFVVPVVLPLAGYFPGKRLKKVGDLPAGVMSQWRRWCLHRDYMMGEGGTALREQYARIRTPILSVSFTDDEFMSERNTESLHGFYAGAPRTMKRIAPADIGERRIGHFGFFRPQFQATLWPQVHGFLSAA